MINLLPVQKKKNIKKEYRLRLAITALFLSCATFSIVFVLLVSQHIVLSAKTAMAQRQKEVLLASLNENFSSDSAEQTNKKLAILKKDISKAVVYRDVFNLIASKRGEVMISGIYYQDDGGAKVQVSGVSPTREDLLLFVKNLEKSGFASVTVPVSSFVKTRDLRFSMDVRI